LLHLYRKFTMRVFYIGIIRIDELSEQPQKNLRSKNDKATFNIVNYFVAYTK